MAQANFGAILDKAPTDIKAPTALPVGTYLTVVQGLPRYDKSTKKGTEYAEYTLSILQAGEDVDPDELAAVEGGVAGKTIKATFYLTDNSLWRLKEFFEHCGLDVEKADSLRELMDQPQGQQVLAYMKHESSTSDDGKTTRVFARLGGTAPVEG